MTTNRPAVAATQAPVQSITDAQTAYDIARQAWANDPGSPDALQAFIAARRTLSALQAGNSSAMPGGPIVLTPVIEWWSTTVEI